MPDFGLERAWYEINSASVTKHQNLVRESFKMLFTKGNSLSLNITELYDYISFVLGKSLNQLKLLSS